MLLGRQPFLKKTYFYSVFLKNDVKKTLNFWTALPKKKNCKMLNNKSELTNWAQNTKQKNTNWHQNLSQKSSKNPIFVVRKWAPQEVVLFLTLEVVPKLTLERPKSGTKTNSPAYIYIYIYERQRECITKIHANLVFQTRILFLRCLTQEHFCSCLVRKKRPVFIHLRRPYSCIIFVHDGIQSLVQRARERYIDYINKGSVYYTKKTLKAPQSGTLMYCTAM